MVFARRLLKKKICFLIVAIVCFLESCNHSTEHLGNDNSKIICHIQADYPERELYLLIGEDNWDCFDQWYNYEDILKHFHIVVYPRNTEHHYPRHRRKNVRFLRTTLLPVSSTMVREMVRKGESVRHLIPAKIADFIEQNHLYQR